MPYYLYWFVTGPYSLRCQTEQNSFLVFSSNNQIFIFQQYNSRSRVFIGFRQKSNQSRLGFRCTEKEKFAVIAYPKDWSFDHNMWSEVSRVFAEASRFRVGVFFLFFFPPLVAKRMIVIIAFYSLAILLSEWLHFKFCDLSPR